MIRVHYISLTKIGQMVPGHISYKAEIKKLKFETDDGIRFPGTALIQFQVDSREKPMVELMVIG